ncbi:hypothetical protein ACFCWY_08680 [Streptomyces sp. NPDC056362]|uniref:hypothetical protein n=1 Tax=unclassified Streptomyces TaxID=2593676 RepID=UPI0035D7EAB8
MATAAPTIPAIARLLALTLPTRKGEHWTVEEHPETGAPAARLSSGSRRLRVVQDATRVEVFAEWPVGTRYRIDVADAVADLTDGETPAVADLTRRLLRVVLPKLDAAHTPREAMTPDDVRQDHDRRVGDLTELGFALLDHGVMPTQHERSDGTFMTWLSAHDGVWEAYTLQGHAGALLRYSGPLRGLYGLLSAVLRPIDAPAPRTAAPDAAPTVFTRHLTDRFPQVRPVLGDCVESGGLDEPSVSVGLPDSPSEEHSDAPTSDDTRVCAEFSVGFDLLLSAVQTLA